MASFQIELHVEDNIRKLINKFREHPDIFFTETDLHSYLYGNLYTGHLEQLTKDGRITSCLHKEYPTNHRYSKDTMQEYRLNKKGKRGNIDLVILNPEFISKHNLSSVASRDIRDIEKRARNVDFRNEMHTAIEMKYIVSQNSNYLKEVQKDNIKLMNGLKYQDFSAYNLVFCNVDYYYEEELEKMVRETNKKINCIYIKSYYNEDNQKITPKPIKNI